MALALATHIPHTVWDAASDEDLMTALDLLHESKEG